MTTELAPWNDERSEVSDVESWSEADPATLLETLIASDDENDYQEVFDLLSLWGRQNSDLILYIDHPRPAERIVDALKTKSLKDFKVALDLAFSRPTQATRGDLSDGLHPFWSWAKEKRTIKTAQQLDEVPFESALTEGLGVTLDTTPLQRGRSTLVAPQQLGYGASLNNSSVQNGLSTVRYGASLSSSTVQNSASSVRVGSIYGSTVTPSVGPEASPKKYLSSRGSRSPIPALQPK